MSSIKNATWVPVKGWEDLYEVSDEGDIRSIKTLRLLRQHARGKNNYMYVGLSRDGQVTQRPVHYVVLESFERPKSPGESPRHKNYDYSDNRRDNLMWSSSATSNAPERFKTNKTLSKVGESSGRDFIDTRMREFDQILRDADGSHFIAVYSDHGVLMLTEYDAWEKTEQEKRNTLG